MKQYTATELKLKAEKKQYFNLWQEAKKVNTDLLEALEVAQSAIFRSKAFNIRKDFSLFNRLAQTIKKAKGEK